MQSAVLQLFSSSATVEDEEQHAKGVVPIVILPGFLNTDASYASLATNLNTWIHQYTDDACTSDIRIVKFSLRDWIKVILGGDMTVYLDRLEEVVTDVFETHGGDVPVRLVGHSAGGWIGRLFLGSAPYQQKDYGVKNCGKVCSLITLGTPHKSIEGYPFRFDEKLDLPPSVRLEKQSSLQFCNYFYPRGDEFEGVRIVCVAGDAIQGEKTLSPNLRNLDNVLAYQAYKAVCGDGSVTGDSVTPVCIALLEKAHDNIILPGVWHGTASRPKRPCLKEIHESENPDIEASALESNIFEWFFAIRGAWGTEFERGIYHGRILMPADYPFNPPAFVMMTPSGRFETGKKICLSISSHHPESWQPSWNVESALLALIAFMQTPGNGAIGSMDSSAEDRREMALESRLQGPPRMQAGCSDRQEIIDQIHQKMVLE
eukprot:jgi/Picre1/33229/NNA_008554.t1